jgi:hypothetical protein
VSDPRLAEYIASLIAERDNYARAGLENRAAEVQAELAKIGNDSEAPAKAAAKRAPAKAKAASK